MPDVAPRTPNGSSRISASKTPEGLLIAEESVGRFIREHRAALGTCLRDLMAGKSVAFRPTHPVTFDVQNNGSPPEVISDIATMQIHALVNGGAMRGIVVEGAVQNGNKSQSKTDVPAQPVQTGDSASPVQTDASPPPPASSSENAEQSSAQVVQDAAEQRSLLQRVKDGWWHFLAKIGWESAQKRKEMVITGRGGGKHIPTLTELVRKFDPGAMQANAGVTSGGSDKRTPLGIQTEILGQIFAAASGEINRNRTALPQMKAIQEQLGLLAKHPNFHTALEGLARRHSGVSTASGLVGMGGSKGEDVSRLEQDFQRLQDRAAKFVAIKEGRLQGSDGKATTSGYGLVRPASSKTQASQTLGGWKKKA